MIGIAVAGAPLSATEQDVRFNRDVRPILADHCFPCHGPSEKDHRAELRLDQKDGVSAVFVPSELTNSNAWRRILSADPDEQMPPPSAHKTLSPEDIAQIRLWIEQGAKWEGHWAFVSPEKPLLPKVKKTAWARNSIDAFVLARLENVGLKPASEADRERLLRRVTFDLTGLPPTIEEVDAFLADDSSHAYDTVVDRLLGSEISASGWRLLGWTSPGTAIAVCFTLAVNETCGPGAIG